VGAAAPVAGQLGTAVLVVEVGVNGSSALPFAPTDPINTGLPVYFSCGDLALPEPSLRRRLSLADAGWPLLLSVDMAATITATAHMAESAAAQFAAAVAAMVVADNGSALWPIVAPIRQQLLSSLALATGVSPSSVQLLSFMEVSVSPFAPLAPTPSPSPFVPVGVVVAVVLAAVAALVCCGAVVWVCRRHRKGPRGDRGSPADGSEVVPNPFAAVGAYDAGTYQALDGAAGTGAGAGTTQGPTAVRNPFVAARGVAVELAGNGGAAAHATRSSVVASENPFRRALRGAGSEKGQ
jgi:hypothetical protein